MCYADNAVVEETKQKSARHESPVGTLGISRLGRDGHMSNVAYTCKGLKPITDNRRDIHRSVCVHLLVTELLLTSPLNP